jgi:hypothetical protein
MCAETIQSNEADRKRLHRGHENKRQMDGIGSDMNPWEAHDKRINSEQECGDILFADHREIIYRSLKGRPWIKQFKINTITSDIRGEKYQRTHKG